LFVGSIAENNRDAREKGRVRYICGEEHVWTKITNQQVVEMKSLRDTGMTFTAIGVIYGVTNEGVIHAVRNRYPALLPAPANEEAPDAD